MKLGKLFKNFQLEKIRLSQRGVSVDISFKPSDRDAAWELYIELLTRIVTQPLPGEAGEEEAALASVHSIFETTREILRERGRNTIEFSKVAVPVLNQVVRPFTAKWHGESSCGALGDTDKQQEFRRELAILQEDLRNYNRLLAEIAGVEDLTDLEPIGKTSNVPSFAT